MVDDVHHVELTSSLLERLEEIDASMSKANLSIAVDDLLSELRAAVIPSLDRFPRIGRRHVDNPPQSVEALAQLAFCRRVQLTPCANICSVTI